MNIQEYISSGIVESYVLGLTSPEESREFENLCRKYPELVHARIAFELSLEKQAMDNSIAAPAYLKQTILNSVANNRAESAAVPVRRMGWLRYVAAASVLLLVGSLLFNISLYTKNKKLRDDYENSITRLNDLEKDLRVLTADPDVKMAKMRGMDIAPQAYATVYWDTASHDVYLLANNLPTPPGDMQYQLWALLNGKPIDLGMLDYDIRQQKLLVRMKNARNAQAFAITLEKKGRTNTAAPEGAMYVMGGL